MRFSRVLSALALLAVAQTSAIAQSTPAAAAAAAPVAARSDVESIDAIMAAIYDVISGPVGVRRDWDRFRSLMAPNARLIPTGRTADGRATYRVLTPDEYATNIGPQLERFGFTERELGRKVERYGNVVHLMSAYEGRRQDGVGPQVIRGVNSFQLWFDGERWYVVTIFWEAETPGNPLPEELLRGRP